MSREGSRCTYPLGTRCATVYAAVVLVDFGDFLELGPGFRVDFPHLAHLDGGCVRAASYPLEG